MEKKKKIALIVGIIAVVGGAIGAVVTLAVRKCMKELDEIDLRIYDDLDLSDDEEASEE